MEKLINIIKVKAKTDFDLDTNLIAKDIIDSIDFIYIISEIEQQYKIEIDFMEINPEDLMSAKGLWNYINELE